MLKAVKKYQELAESERLIYRAGRRAGAYRSTDDLQRDPETYQKIKNLVQEVKSQEGGKGVEKFITGLADRYI